MSNYKLVTIDQRFIAETIARTGSEQLLEKASRNYVGLYDEKENWYLPLRANLSKKKPEGAYFSTPFETRNIHFKRPGLDFEKSLYVPKEMVQEIRNTLPKEQANFIKSNQKEIKRKFEKYILKIKSLSENSVAFDFSTVPLFPEGIAKIIEQAKEKKDNRQETKTPSTLDTRLAAAKEKQSQSASKVTPGVEKAKTQNRKPPGR